MTAFCDMIICDLTTISSWASIVSLFFSCLSVALVLNIKSHIVKHKRRLRVRRLIEDIMRGSSEDAIPLNHTSGAKLVSLKGNTPVSIFLRYSEMGKKNSKMHECIDDCLVPDIDKNDGVKKLALLKEAIEDWGSCLPEDV